MSTGTFPLVPYEPDAEAGGALLKQQQQVLYTQVKHDSEKGTWVKGKRRLGKKWARGVCVGQGAGFAFVLRNGNLIWATPLRTEADGRKTLDVAAWLAKPETTFGR